MSWSLQLTSASSWYCSPWSSPDSPVLDRTCLAGLPAPPGQPPQRLLHARVNMFSGCWLEGLSNRAHSVSLKSSSERPILGDVINSQARVDYVTRASTPGPPVVASRSMLHPLKRVGRGVMTSGSGA